MTTSISNKRILELAANIIDAPQSQLIMFAQLLQSEILLKELKAREEFERNCG